MPKHDPLLSVNPVRCLACGAYAVSGYWAIYHLMHDHGMPEKSARDSVEFVTGSSCPIPREEDRT